jgi:peptidyl-prolyl cis-trans isomerase C
MLKHNSIFFYILILISLLVASCSIGINPTPTVPLPTETAILQPPTPTSLPMAILVNNEGILLTDYHEEYQRLETAVKSLGKTLTAEEMKTMVIDDLVGTELLNQAAKKNGFTISDADVTARADQLAQSMGGPDVFNTWKTSMFFTEASFKRSIVRSMGSAWQRDQIIKLLPETAEQVHARQILFVREESAISYKQRVDNGSDFAELAKEADPITGGDLSWFPKGYLLQPEVEAAAYALQPGEVSAVIKSAIGFHLIQVIEKDPARIIDADVKSTLQRNAVIDWVNQEKSKSQIQILIP